MSPAEAVVALFGTIAVCATPLTGLYIWVHRPAARTKAPPRMDSPVEERLERIEQAIDAMAVEVERISEGQRFTTKLLSERATGGTGDASPAVKPAARVITPH